jgi:hypothetical protein
MPLPDKSLTINILDSNDAILSNFKSTVYSCFSICRLWKPNVKKEKKLLKQFYCFKGYYKTTIVAANPTEAHLPILKKKRIAVAVPTKPVLSLKNRYTHLVDSLRS